MYSIRYDNVDILKSKMFIFENQFKFEYRGQSRLLSREHKSKIHKKVKAKVQNQLKKVNTPENN